MQRDPAISSTILSVAADRGREKNNCPSEIARMLYPFDWRSRMKEVLDESIELHLAGK